MLAATMADSSDSFQLVSVAEACRILNLSDSTVRRLLRAGRLEAEKVQRAQGHVWLVKVPAPTGTLSDDPPRQIGVADGHPPGPPALAAWMSSVLEPMMAELSVTRHQLVSQAETIGRVTAERDAAQTAHASILAAQSAPASVGAPVPVWRSWWPWLMLLAVVVLSITLLVWLR